MNNSSNHVQELEMMLRLLSEYANCIGQFAVVYSDAKKPFGSPEYPYIPLNHLDFTNLILKLRHLIGVRGRPCRFLDIGCGIGDKIVLAHLVGFASHGIECDDFLLKKAKHILHLSQSDAQHKYSNLRPTIEKADVLHYGYKPFDILYMYCPFQDDNRQRQLEKQIYQNARLGAYIVPIRATLLPPSNDYDLLETINGMDNITIPIYRRLRKGKADWRRRVSNVESN